MQFTTQQISDMFFGIPTWKSYEDLSIELSTRSLEVTPVMLQELFKANGHNLRNRPRKPNLIKSWFTIIDSEGSVNRSTVNQLETEEVA